MSRVHPAPEDTEDSPLLLRALALLRVELAHPERARRTLEKLTQLISEHLPEPASERKGFNSSVPLRARSQHVLRALALLHENPARRWTIQQLAKACGVSRAALARHFAAALGAPPFRYLAELRLRRAAELLVSTDASLAEIAALVGYDSEFAFNRAFKRHHRVPPGVFRRRSRELPVRASATLPLSAALVESTASRGSTQGAVPNARSMAAYGSPRLRAVA